MTACSFVGSMTLPHLMYRGIMLHVLHTHCLSPRQSGIEIQT